ncbi:MAG: phage holin family protein [Clostridium sp.]
MEQPKRCGSGIAKKVARISFEQIAAAMVSDYIIIQTSDVLRFTLPNTILSLLVTVWYLLNEALSITENAGRMGAPVPGWLMKYIAALKSKITVTIERMETAQSAGKR